jgi:hypothetical protein
LLRGWWCGGFDGPARLALVRAGGRATDVHEDRCAATPPARHEDKNRLRPRVSAGGRTSPPEAAGRESAYCNLALVVGFRGGQDFVPCEKEGGKGGGRKSVHARFFALLFKEICGFGVMYGAFLLYRACTCPFFFVVWYVCKNNLVCRFPSSFLLSPRAPVVTSSAQNPSRVPREGGARERRAT